MAIGGSGGGVIHPSAFPSAQIFGQNNLRSIPEKSPAKSDLYCDFARVHGADELQAFARAAKDDAHVLVGVVADVAHRIGAVVEFPAEMDRAALGQGGDDLHPRRSEERRVGKEGRRWW